MPAFHQDVEASMAASDLGPGRGNAEGVGHIEVDELDRHAVPAG
jgi:hypothetical protein